MMGLRNANNVIGTAIELVKKHRECCCKRKQPDEHIAISKNEHSRKKKYV